MIHKTTSYRMQVIQFLILFKINNKGLMESTEDSLK
jgi:hypothetical protein